MPIDNRIISERNTLAVLLNLHRFGWLTSRMIAAVVWPHAKQATAMAHRTLNAMQEKKLILRRLLPAGGYCYTLAARGVRTLADLTGVISSSGASIKLGNSVHRAAANWYLIAQINDGHTVWTEHEIQTGRAPVVTINGKVPDGLITTPEGLIWVEVENAWKNRKERAKVIDFAKRQLTRTDRLVQLAPGHYLTRIAIVGTTVDALRAIYRSFNDAYVRNDMTEGQLADVDLALLPVSPSLAAGPMTTGNLWYEAILPSLEPERA